MTIRPRESLVKTTKRLLAAGYTARQILLWMFGQPKYNKIPEEVIRKSVALGVRRELDELTKIAKENMPR